MVILFCILLWVLSDIEYTSDKVREYSEREAERRFQELMSAKQNKTITVRREIHDSDGKYAVEEITEEI